MPTPVTRAARVSSFSLSASIHSVTMSSPLAPDRVARSLGSGLALHVRAVLPVAAVVLVHALEGPLVEHDAEDRRPRLLEQLLGPHEVPGPRHARVDDEDDAVH